MQSKSIKFGGLAVALAFLALLPHVETGGTDESIVIGVPHSDDAQQSEEHSKQKRRQEREVRAGEKVGRRTCQQLSRHDHTSLSGHVPPAGTLKSLI